MSRYVTLSQTQRQKIIEWNPLNSSIFTVLTQNIEGFIACKGKLLLLLYGKPLWCFMLEKDVPGRKIAFICSPI